MSKLSKSEQARLNGAKSKGPVTPDGKARSSQNSLKHGLTGRSAILLQDEDPNLFKELHDAYYTQWQPANQVEADLVDEMICARWLLRRYTSIETALLDIELDTILPTLDAKYERIDPAAALALAFKSLADNSSALQLLRRYLTSVRRAYRDALNSLLALRAAQPEALETSEPASQTPQPEKNDETNPPHPQVIDLPQPSPTTPPLLPHPEERAA